MKTMGVFKLYCVLFVSTCLFSYASNEILSQKAQSGYLKCLELKKVYDNLDCEKALSILNEQEADSKKINSLKNTVLKEGMSKVDRIIMQVGNQQEMLEKLKLEAISLKQLFESSLNLQQTQNNSQIKNLEITGNFNNSSFAQQKKEKEDNLNVSFLQESIENKLADVKQSPVVSAKETSQSDSNFRSMTEKLKNGSSGKESSNNDEYLNQMLNALKNRLAKKEKNNSIGNQNQLPKTEQVQSSDSNSLAQNEAELNRLLSSDLLKNIGSSNKSSQSSTFDSVLNSLQKSSEALKNLKSDTEP